MLAPVPLFQTQISGGAVPGANRQQYSVSADGQQFLMSIRVADAEVAPPITMVLNWKPGRKYRAFAEITSQAVVAALLMPIPFKPAAAWAMVSVAERSSFGDRDIPFQSDRIRLIDQRIRIRRSRRTRLIEIERLARRPFEAAALRGTVHKRKPRTGTFGLVPMDGVESRERSLIGTTTQRPGPCPSQASLGKPPRGPSHVSHTIVPCVTSF